MIIVLDTTETFADPLLTGPNFVLLRSYVARNSAKLFVPSLVFEETIKHFREHLTQHVKSAQSKLRSLERILPSDKGIPKLEVNEEECVAEYRTYLEGRIKWLSGKVVGFDNVPLESLVSRSLQKRKPFDGEGRKGFRDAVLWETVVREIIQPEGRAVRVALISKNSKDFGQKEILADELKQDCVAVGGSADAVTLYNGLPAFADKEIKPQLEKLDSIFESIKEDGEYHKFVPTDFFLENKPSIESEINSHLRWYDGRTIRSLDERFHSLKLNELDRAGDWTLADVWKVDDERIACGIDFHVEAKIECQESIAGYYPEGDEVFSHEWDEEFIGDTSLTISMIVIVTQADGEVEEYEVSDLDIDFGFDWRR